MEKTCDVYRRGTGPVRLWWEFCPPSPPSNGGGAGPAFLPARPPAGGAAPSARAPGTHHTVEAGREGAPSPAHTQRERERASLSRLSRGRRGKCPNPGTRKPPPPPSDRWEGGRGTGRRQLNSAGASERACVCGEGLGGCWGVDIVSRGPALLPCGHFCFPRKKGTLRERERERERERDFIAQ